MGKNGIKNNEDIRILDKDKIIKNLNTYKKIGHDYSAKYSFYYCFLLVLMCLAFYQM